MTLSITRTAEAAEISVNYSDFVIGIVAHYMTWFFAGGIDLENEVDGLL